MNIALILSGGTGSRLGADIPKQYIKVNGKSIISYCLETFEKCNAVDAIWVVAEECWQETIREQELKKLQGFSKPGLTRQLSILNGLQDLVLFAGKDDIVIIHDAARPLISAELIKRVLDAAGEHDGAIPVLPMKDTVYMSEDGQRITSLLDRNCLYAGQAPESFVLGKYYEANRQLSSDAILKVNGSTEPAVMAGLDIAMIAGEEQNFKITTEADLNRFREIVKE